MNDSYISVYHSGEKSIKSIEEIPLEMFLNQIKSGKWTAEINNLRNQFAEFERTITDAKKLREAKSELKRKTLPAVTLSATFSDRSKAGIKSHNGYIGIDIDKTDPEVAKKKLRNDPYVYSMFTSCSGTGLCVIFKINPLKHLESFNGLAEYLWGNYRLIVDESGKDVSRLRFISDDADLFINDHAKEFKQYPKKEVGRPKADKKREVVFIQSEFEYILSQITFDITAGYHQWLKIGFALSNKFGEEGRKYFHEISQHGDYSERECDLQYDNCLKSTGSGITIASFYWICKENSIPIASPAVANISKRAATQKKANSTREQSIKNIIEFPDYPDASLELVSHIVNEVYDKDIFIEDISDIETGRIWIRNRDLKYNLVTARFECEGKSITDVKFKSLRLKMCEELPDLDRHHVTDLLESDAIIQYNPIKDAIFQRLKDYPADTSGSIAELAACIKSPMPVERIEVYLTKYLVGIMASVFTEDESHIFPILAGKAVGKGKSYFWKNLFPKELSTYNIEKKFHEAKGDSFKRDCTIAAAENIQMYADDMGEFTAASYAALKGVISSSYSSERAAYGKFNERRKRICGFAGTSNQLNLISDAELNRRIILIEVLEIDQERKDKIEQWDYLIEAYRLFKDGYNYKLLNGDIDTLAADMSDYQMGDETDNIIFSKFAIPGPNDYTEYLTAAEIVSRLERDIPGIKLDPQKVGNRLAAKKFIRVQKRWLQGGNPFYKWAVNPLSGSVFITSAGVVDLMICATTETPF